MMVNDQALSHKYTVLMKSFIPLIRSEWRLLLFGFLLMFFSSPGQTYFIALFSGEIRSDMGLSHGEFGGIYSLATLVSAAVLLWSGALIDRMDLRKFAYAVVTGLAIGCLLMASSQGVVALFIGILLLRQFGQGLMYMTSTTAMVRYLDHQKGKANALSSMGSSVAEAALPSLAIMLMLLLSWRQSWVVFAVILMVLLPVAIHYLLRGHERRHQQYEASLAEDDNDPSPKYRRRQWKRAEVIRDPLFYLSMPGLMAQPLLFTGFMFHQVHLVEEKGWSLVAWGGLYVLYALVSVVVRLFTGVLVDNFGAVVLVAFGILPMGIGLLVLASSSSMLAAAIFMIFTGITSGANSTISAPFFSEKYGNRHLGAIKSLATAMMVFMSALSPVLMGWWIDQGVTMNTLAVGGAMYILITATMAHYAYWLAKRQLAAA